MISEYRDRRLSLEESLHMFGVQMREEIKGPLNRWRLYLVEKRWEKALQKESDRGTTPVRLDNTYYKGRNHLTIAALQAEASNYGLNAERRILEIEQQRNEAANSYEEIDKVSWRVDRLMHLVRTPYADKSYYRDHFGTDYASAADHAAELAKQADALLARQDGYYQAHYADALRAQATAYERAYRLRAEAAGKGWLQDAEDITVTNRFDGYGVDVEAKHFTTLSDKLDLLIESKKAFQEAEQLDELVKRERANYVPERHAELSAPNARQLVEEREALVHAQAQRQADAQAMDAKLERLETSWEAKPGWELDHMRRCADGRSWQQTSLLVCGHRNGEKFAIFDEGERVLPASWSPSDIRAALAVQKDRGHSVVTWMGNSAPLTQNQRDTIWRCAQELGIQVTNVAPSPAAEETWARQRQQLTITAVAANGAEPPTMDRMAASWRSQGAAVQRQDNHLVVRLADGIAIDDGRSIRYPNGSTKAMEEAGIAAMVDRGVTRIAVSANVRLDQAQSDRLFLAAGARDLANTGLQPSPEAMQAAADERASRRTILAESVQARPDGSLIETKLVAERGEYKLAITATDAEGKPSSMERSFGADRDKAMSVQEIMRTQHRQDGYALTAATINAHQLAEHYGEAKAAEHAAGYKLEKVGEFLKPPTDVELLSASYERADGAKLQVNAVASADGQYRLDVVTTNAAGKPITASRTLDRDQILDVHEAARTAAQEQGYKIADAHIDVEPFQARFGQREIENQVASFTEERDNQHQATTSRVIGEKGTDLKAAPSPAPEAGYSEASERQAFVDRLKRKPQAEESKAVEIPIQKAGEQEAPRRRLSDRVNANRAVPSAPDAGREADAKRWGEKSAQQEERAADRSQQRQHEHGM